MATKEPSLTYTMEDLERRIVIKKNVIEYHKKAKADYQQQLRVAEEKKLALETKASNEEERIQLEAEIKQCKKVVQEYERLINQNESELHGFEREKDKESKRLLKEALRSGYVTVRIIICLLLGMSGVGKTCLKSLLLNMPPPLVRNSTPCAERPTRAHIRSTSGLKVKREKDGWKEIDEKQLVELIAEALHIFELITNTPTSLEDIPGLKALLEHEEMSTDDGTSNQASATSPDSQQQQPQEKPTESRKMVTSIFEEIEKEITKCRDDRRKELKERRWRRLFENLTDTDEEPSQTDQSKEIFGSDWVYFTDSGGQPQFHEVLPLFIHNTSATLFVTRLSESLDSYPLVEYYKDGKPVGRAQCSTITTIDNLKCLIRSMQSRPSKEKPPKIIVVGTHKDLMKRCPEKLDEKNKRLLELLREYSDSLVFFSQDLQQLIFPVDTAHPGEKEMEIAKNIRGLIERTVVEEVKVPIWWYILELLLHQLANHLGRGVLSRRECLEIAHALQFHDDAFDSALSFFHDLNVFHYYPDTLPEVVFVNSQVPLDKLTELVDFSFSLRQGTSSQSSCGPLEGKWLHFRDQGIIEVEFLEKFQQHYVQGLFTPHSFLKLLNKLLIAAPLTDDTTQPDSLPAHLMPSLLEMLPSSELEKHRIFCSAAAPLLIRFPEGWPRAGVFCCLVIHLMNVCGWKVTHRPGKLIFVSRNCIKFCLPKSPCFITLIDAFSHIEVHVKAPAKVCREMCPMIQKSIISGIEAACTKLHYSNDHPHLAIYCPHTTDDDDDETTSSEQQPSSKPPPSLEQLSLSEQQSLDPKQTPSSSTHDTSSLTTTQQQSPLTKETPSTKEIHSVKVDKPKPHAALVMEEYSCWMCTESDMFGDLDAKHEIWLTTSAKPVHGKRSSPVNQTAGTVVESTVPSSSFDSLLVSKALSNLLDWHKLGLLLGMKKIKLDEIRLDFDKYGNARQRDEMIGLWIRSDKDASWEKLCTALENMDQNTISEQIRTRYCTM